MILAIDIGNTTVALGGIRDGRVCFVAHMDTVRTRTAAEYRAEMEKVFSHRRHPEKPIRFEGAVLTSVVPQITGALAEELAELARSKKLFLFEAVTTQYQDNYAKIREVLPKVGAVTMVQCNFSQYSSRYHDFCAGKVWPSFDPACAGGALMDLGVYNVSYVVGLFGSPNKVHYAANITRGIDTSGVLTMEYRSFKAVSINAKDSSSPARYIIQGTKGYLLQKSTANFCGGVTFHPYKGKEEHFNLSAGRPRQAAEFHAFARAIESEDMELCSRMLDTSVAVSRVLETARRDAGIRFATDL